MKFIDHTKIYVQGGKGGNGVIAFRREAKVSKGGPDGGDGGRGGNVFFKGEEGMNTLLHLQLQKKVLGKDGENGRYKNQYGAKGPDVFIPVPLGTQVYVEDQLVADIKLPIAYLIAEGGKPGRGNNKFKSSRNRTPMICENGELGESKFLNLELKVLADVGLIGKPNAGKSTLLSAISNAKPKIANYEFTTLNPQLGLVKAQKNSFVVADLPGLIKGAAIGKGLGHEFLKHIERCKVIAHVIDFGSDNKDPVIAYQEIKEELKIHSYDFESRSEIIIANKKDLPDFAIHLKAFKKVYPQLKIVEISALTFDNLEILKLNMYEVLKNSKEIELQVKDDEITIKLDEDFTITKISNDTFEVSGKQVESIYHKVPLNTHENLLRFNQKLKNIGV
jgi:GTP-binding protein